MPPTRTAHYATLLPAPPFTQAMDWSPCSALCGGAAGYSTRAVQCVSTWRWAGGAGQVLPEEACLAGPAPLLRPQQVRSCVSEACPRVRWAVSEQWSVCSAECTPTVLDNGTGTSSESGLGFSTRPAAVCMVLASNGSEVVTDDEACISLALVRSP